MKRRNILWTLSAVGLLNACSFVLDFDALQKSTTTSASVAAAEAKPDAGPVVCASPCVASDSCFESSCINGKCVETPRTGFVSDNDERDVPADKIYRTTTTAGDGKLVAATYGIFSGKPDLVIRSFDSVSGELQEAHVSNAFAASSYEEEEIGSPAGLVVVGGSLHVYFATRPSASASASELRRAGNVWRLRYSSANLSEPKLIRAAESANFRFNGDTLGPAAGVSKGEAFVVWPGCTTSADSNPKTCVVNEPASGSRAGIYLQKGNTVGYLTDENARISAATEVTDLVALAAPKPGAAWLTNLPGGRTGVLQHGYEGLDTGDLTLESVCNKTTGFAGRALSATATPLGDALALWASGNATSAKPASEWYQLSCNSVPCLLDQKTTASRCEASTAPANTWASAVGMYQPRTEESIYLVAVHLAQSGPNTGVTLSLSPFVEDADAGAPAPATTALLPATDPENLDWPSIAIGSDGHALVSWQTRDKDNNEVVHLSRQRVCTGVGVTP